MHPIHIRTHGVSLVGRGPLLNPITIPQDRPPTADSNPEYPTRHFSFRSGFFPTASCSAMSTFPNLIHKNNEKRKT